MLNGFPTNDVRFRAALDAQSNTASQNLAGNGFPSTIVAAFVIAIMFSFQEGAAPKEGAGVAGADECEAAVLLLKRARRSADS